MQNEIKTEELLVPDEPKVWPSSVTDPVKSNSPFFDRVRESIKKQKNNADGAINEYEGPAAGGMAYRGGFGFIAAQCRVYQKIVDPPVIEVLALQDACTYVNEKGFAQVIFESDCADLMHLWTERDKHRAVIAPILCEIEKLSQFFTSFEISFVRREANSAAHE